MSAESTESDVEVENHGGLFLFRPGTDAGREWLEEHAPPGPDTLYFGEALVVEHRYAPDLARVMLDHGLRVT